MEKRSDHFGVDSHWGAKIIEGAKWIDNQRSLDTDGISYRKFWFFAIVKEASLQNWDAHIFVFELKSNEFTELNE